jgi:hypothetical protein
MPIAVSNVAAFVDDYIRVVSHLLGDTTNAYPWNPKLEDLAASVRSGDFAPVWLIAKVVSWCLFEMSWRRKYRPLTPDEIAIEDAGWRLSDALHGGERGRP